jgi:hypothetical protein
MVSRIARIAPVALAVAALGLSGCSQPLSAPHAPIFQQSAGAVIHWEASARRVFDSMEALGAIETPMHPARPGQAPSPGPYYVYIQQPGSTFLEEVRNTFEYLLMKQGAQVVRSPGGATVINLDIDAVQWGSLVAENELIWRATIVTSNRVVMKSTDLLYISSADANLYHGSTTLAPLSSPGVSLLGALAPLRYAH